MRLRQLHIYKLHSIIPFTLTILVIKMQHTPIEANVNIPTKNNKLTNYKLHYHRLMSTIVQSKNKVNSTSLWWTVKLFLFPVKYSLCSSLVVS